MNFKGGFSPGSLPRDDRLTNQNWVNTVPTSDFTDF